MKRYVFIILLVLAAIFIGKEVKAEESRYYNLINMDQVAYDSSSDVFYSNQEISLKKDTNYTFVASSNFFGSITESDSLALSGKNINIKVISESSINELSFKLEATNNSLYYSSIITKSDYKFSITDFLTKGYTLETLPKDEVILYEGTKEDFKGFRKNEFLENYDKTSNTMNIYTSCTNPIKVEEITNNLMCYDNEIGFYNEFTLETDSYQNTSIPGDYSVIYKTADSSGNEATLTVNVHVVDDEAPIITGDDIIEWDCYDFKPLIKFFVKRYKAYDTCDGDLSSEIKMVCDIDKTYEIGVEKDYICTLSVEDSSGNITYKEVVIQARDRKAPELTLTDITINLSDLGKSSFNNFYSQVVVEVIDNSSAYELSYEMKEVIGKFGFSGTFEVTVTAKDKSGNETVKTATIRVIDDIAPEFYMRKELLTTTSEKVYTVSELKELISNTLYEDGILYDSIDLISCDYFSNEKNPGKYTVKYAYSYKGSTNYVIGTINVVEKAEQKSPAILLLLVGIPIVIGVVTVVIKRKKSY